MKRKKKIQETKYEINREYKYDRAMQEAIKRASSHPKPISVVSNVPEFNKFAYNK